VDPINILAWGERKWGINPQRAKVHSRNSRWANSILALRYAWIHSPLQEVRDSMSTSTNQLIYWPRPINILHRWSLLAISNGLSAYDLYSLLVTWAHQTIKGSLKSKNSWDMVSLNQHSSLSHPRSRSLIWEQTTRPPAPPAMTDLPSEPGKMTSMLYIKSEHSLPGIRTCWRSYSLMDKL